MTNTYSPNKINADTRTGQRKPIDGQSKKPVDVATLEKSSASSAINPQSPGPAAAGEASS